MKFIAMLILIYSFIKSLYYGLYEINEKENKPGGIAVIILAILGLIFPIVLLFLLY